MKLYTALLCACLSMQTVLSVAGNKHKDRFELENMYEFLSHIPNSDKKAKIFEAFREGGHAARVHDSHSIRYADRKLQNAINDASTESHSPKLLTRFQYMMYGFFIGAIVIAAMK